MCGLVLVEKVPDIDTHTNILPPRVAPGFNLLFCITCRVVNKMFWLVCTWNRESFLRKVLSHVSKQYIYNGGNLQGHWTLLQHQRRLHVQQ